MNVGERPRDGGEAGVGERTTELPTDHYTLMGTSKIQPEAVNGTDRKECEGRNAQGRARKGGNSIICR